MSSGTRSAIVARIRTSVRTSSRRAARSADSLCSLSATISRRFADLDSMNVVANVLVRESPPTRRPRASANREDRRVRPSRGEPACQGPLRTADAVSFLREPCRLTVLRFHPLPLARRVRVAVALKAAVAHVRQSAWAFSSVATSRTHAPEPRAHIELFCDCRRPGAHRDRLLLRPDRGEAVPVGLDLVEVVTLAGVQVVLLLVVV